MPESIFHTFAVSRICKKIITKKSQKSFVFQKNNFTFADEKQKKQKNTT